MRESGDDGPEPWRGLRWGRAHMRDVLALFGRRVAQEMADDDPEFGWWPATPWLVAATSSTPTPPNTVPASGR